MQMDDTKRILYDPLSLLQESVRDDAMRNTMEGAIVLVSAYNLTGGDPLRARKMPSEAAKKDIASIIRNELDSYASLLATDTTRCAEVCQEYVRDAAKEYDLKFLDMGPVRGSYSLFAAVLKLARFGKIKNAIFQTAGEQIEKKIESLYSFHAVPLAIESRTMEDVGRARTEEYNFLARVVHEIYCRERMKR